MTNGKKLILALLLLAGIFSFMFGSSLAKYQDVKEGAVTFVTRSQGTFLVSEPEEEGKRGWLMQPDGSYRLGFTVSNQEKAGGSAHSSDLCYTIRIGITGHAEEGTVSLVTLNPVGTERAYTGSKEAWETTTTQYINKGPGYWCVFYDEAEQELVWELDGGKVSSRDFFIELRGVTSPGLVEIRIKEAAKEG